jgi:hypothetical protein
MAISVLVAVEPVADELIEKIASRMSGLRVGDGRRNCDMGPLITKEHRDKVAGYIDIAIQDGATVVVDGRGIDVDGEKAGFWLGPTLIDAVPTSSRVYTDEIFGPVLSVVRVASYDEGVALINESRYGNGTAIFTNDGGAARRFQREVHVGMIGINVPIPVPVAYYSFGGWKDSLFGDSKAYGPDGIHFFTRQKAITRRWLDRINARVEVSENRIFPSNDLLNHIPLLIVGVADYLEDPERVVVGEVSVVAKAMELAKTHGWFLTRQFENESNPDMHSRTTAREILEDFAGERLDYWVTGYGTGGTLKGVARVLAKERPETAIIVCEPQDAPLLGSGAAQQRNPDGSASASHPTFKSHPMQGWTPDFIPKLTGDAVDMKLITRILSISNDEAMQCSRDLASKEGIFVGITSGAGFAGALRICKEAPKGATVLCMLPDTGERYLSTPLFANVPVDMNEEELKISRSTPAAQLNG